MKDKMQGSHKTIQMEEMVPAKQSKNHQPAQYIYIQPNSPEISAINPEICLNFQQESTRESASKVVQNKLAKVQEDGHKTSQ